MVRVWVARKTVYPLVTRGPYLSSLEVQHDKALYKFKLLFTLLALCVQRADTVVPGHAES